MSEFVCSDCPDVPPCRFIDESDEVTNPKRCAVDGGRANWKVVVDREIPKDQAVLFL